MQDMHVRIDHENEPAASGTAGARAWPVPVNGCRSGRELGDRLAQLYALWRGQSGRPTLPSLASVHLARLGVTDLACPLAQSARQVGDVAQCSMQSHSYHNADHVAEVLNNAVILCEINDLCGALPLDGRDRLLLSVAALGHDLGHDGTTNAGQPFRLEKVAARVVRRIMQECGCDSDEIADVETLILATEPGKAAVVKALARWGEGRVERAPAAEAVPQELRRLVGNRRLAVMAGMLQDADLLSSAGLNISYNDLQSERLGEEMGKAPTPDATLFFIDKIVGGAFTTTAGAFFDENLADIRAMAEARKQNLDADT